MDEQLILLRYRQKPPEGYHLVDLSDVSKQIWKRLSPAIISNVYCYGGLSSKTMHNAWTYSHVYPEHDDGGKPNADWYTWRDTGFSREKAIIKPMKDSKPIYIWWNGVRFGEIEARKNIYIPLYLRSIKNSQTFKELRRLYERGNKLALKEWHSYPLDDGKTSKDALNDISRNFSYAFIVYHLLTNCELL